MKNNQKQTIDSSCPHCENIVNLRTHQTNNDEYEVEHEDKKRIPRVIASLVLLVVGFFIPQDFSWLQFTIWLVSYVIVGGDVLFEAVRSAFNKKIMDENFLMSIASLGAFVIGQYPEGVAVMIFFQLGEFFQDKALDKSQKEVAKLMDIKPAFAHVQRNNEVIKVDPQTVKVDELIVVKVGEKIPLDGVITKGESSLNTSALTGESLPRDVSVGDEVLSGSINEHGVLTIKVTRTNENSTVNKILELITKASNKKSVSERFITRFARVYTPVVVLIAILIMVVLPFWGGWSVANLQLWVYRALVFLVVSCPCALVISVPLSFVGGLGNLAKQGVLVKGTTYLEKLWRVKTLVFDKTGTLTTGNFEIEEINVYKPFTKDELIKIAMSVESFSNHPLAISLTKNYVKIIDKNSVSQVKEIAGEGMEATYKNKHVIIGNEKLLKRNKITYEKITSVNTVLYVWIDKHLAGTIVLADQVKSDASNVLNEIKNKKQVDEIVMLTGDKEEVATQVAKKLNITNYYGELLPTDKMTVVEKLMNADNKKQVAVVGDGINDAPILMRADVGIAMGQMGSDAAIEAADVVIMTDELARIPNMLNISKRTVNVAYQNIVFALLVKTLVMTLSVFGMMSMWAAVFADMGVTLLAIGNAMRLLRVKS